MDIQFDTKKLAKTFADAKTIKRIYGARAGSIMQRLAEFDAADTLEDMRTLPAANCHELTGGNKRGHFAVDISRNYRLIFRPAQQPPPVFYDGGINWSEVRSITIIQIEDYH